MSSDQRDRSLPEVMHERYEAEDGTLGDIPVGGLADQPVAKLVGEAQMVDHPQSLCATVYGGYAMREAMVRYYDGDAARALAVLDECSTTEQFARLWLLADAADLDWRPRPVDA